MGREVRKVPQDWNHPVDRQGDFVPLFGDSYAEDRRRWEEDKRLWDQRALPGVSDEEYDAYTFEDYDGGAPDPARYMPDWPAKARTHYVMYETTTEGTPLSPGFDSPEKLARWLADNAANAGCGRTATYEQWLEMIRIGSSPTGRVDSAGVRSGVESLGGAAHESHESPHESKPR